MNELANLPATAESEWLCPSNLPKLARCGHYRPAAEEGEAAARGSSLDGIFRRAITSGRLAVPGLSADDREALAWAVETAHALAGGLPLVAEEAGLAIECLGLQGTADLLCPEAAWSADLKTGQRRNYREQQAANALAFMDSHFVEEWTVYLLFCDLHEVETLRFTRESAEQLVRSVLAAAKGAEPPVANDYCGWCARRWDCPARREALGILPVGGPDARHLEAQPSALLRSFIQRAGVVEDFAAQARELLKARLLAGEKIPGCALVAKRGPRKAPEHLIETHWKALGTADLVAAYGPMSEAKLRAIWARKLPDLPFPEDELEELPGSTFIRVSTPRE